jgi:hypothetical protein
MPNTFPYEVMGSPFSIYAGATGTARPAIGAAPSGSWTLVGSNGNRSYAEEGVRVNSPQAFNYFRGLGSAAPLKAFRTEEDVIVQVSLADLTLEELARAFNDNTVTEVAITRTLPLTRGLTVATGAILVRGPSPYMDDGFSQFWLPLVVNVSSPELAMRRDNATIYPLEWRCLWYPDATTGEELGVYEAEDETT